MSGRIEFESEVYYTEAEYDKLAKENDRLEAEMHELEEMLSDTVTKPIWVRAQALKCAVDVVSFPVESKEPIFQWVKIFEEYIENGYKRTDQK